MSLTRWGKTALAAVLGIALWMGGQAHAAGTIPLAMAQQVDVNGAPLANCQLSFFVAGTISSPQNAYSDFGLTQALPNPLSCDQAGRIPMFWLADGLIHVRLTDASGGGGISGGPIFDTTMQVLGPSSGGGGGGSTVDPTTILATGDIKARYDNAPISGWVRLNGLTIGNATSGASERANADTQALFIYFYNKDSTLAVSGGRTGNALNDFNSSKQLTLPDMRARALAGLADMGNSDVGLFAGVTFQTGNATTLGSRLGAARRSLLVGNIPSITSVNGSQSISVAGSGSANVSGTVSVSGSVSGTVSVTSSSSQIPVSSSGTVRGDYVTPNSPSVAFVAGSTTPFNIGQVSSSGSNTLSGSMSGSNSMAGTASVTASGSNSISVTSSGTLGSAFDSVSTYALVTIYAKL